MELRVSRCSTCGTPFVWGSFARSHVRVPIDVEPYEDGNLVLVGSGPDGGPVVDLASVVERQRSLPTGGTLFDNAEQPPPLPPERYKTHFSTCPQATEHRRRK